MENEIKLKVGDAFYIKNDPRKYHVIEILEKERYPQVVLKYYGKHKQWWHYEIEPKFSIIERLRIGLYRREP